MRGCPLSCLLAALLIAPSAHAQQQERLIAEAELVELVESYDPTAQVSGPPLVGLRLGPVEGHLDPQGLVVVRPDAQGLTICVRTTSQDGRLSASGKYRIEADRPNAAYVRLRPVAQKHEAEFSRYPGAEVGIRVYATRSAECLPEKPVHLPFFADEGLVGAERLALVVFANGRSQVGSAALYEPDGGGPLARADCERAGAASLIAYDLRCPLELPVGAGGRLVLQLSFNDGFATTDYRFDVRLPERGGR